MHTNVEYLSPSEAAGRLGVSVKALRVYEDLGLVKPQRLSNGWRAYGPEPMALAARVCALRGLGLSLAQIGRVMAGDQADLGSALQTQEASLKSQMEDLGGRLQRLKLMRDHLAAGDTPDLETLRGLGQASAIQFALPWPWGGEIFVLPELGPLNFITGPLGCGKTRLAKTLGEVLPRAHFLGLERKPNGEVNEVRQSLDWLIEDGASESEALVALLEALSRRDIDVLIIDMVEQDLDEASQAALMAYLRRPDRVGPKVILMTRSDTILDFAAMGLSERIIFCPANHSPPTWVLPIAGSTGAEAVTSCLASREVLARTEGTIAWRPEPEAAATAT